MRFREIFITCPSCKKEFVDSEIISMQAAHRKYLKEALSGSRKCPNCKELVDITNDNNFRYTPKSRLKRFKNWITGHRYYC